ncbi:restriction endonuclease subunit S [Geminocystis sp. CENA526]|uniref:restriction endonuclease subunit S n=1 Tax=Geminocystis sp. CENA526 TaxID=1355871 RepID=UPI003D6F8AC2
MSKNMGFKDSPLGLIPDDWEIVTIEDIGTIYSGGTPSRDNPSFWGGDIAWVTPTEITSLKGKYLTETREYITKAGLIGSSANLMPKDTLLITTRATIGYVAISQIPITTNQGFKSIVTNQSCNPNFYYHFLKFIASEMIRLASGSTFDEISRRDFSSIFVVKPPRKEQEKIAEILDKVDSSIELTEALIKKLKQIKAGLLQDLLTRGLDEKGELRNPDTHPEQFKDSPLGKIPITWEVATLESISTDKPYAIVDGPFGSNLKTEHYREQGIPVIQSGFVTSGKFFAESYVYVDQFLFNTQKRSAVEAGDIVMAKIGAQCGTSAILPKDHSVGILAGNSLKISIHPNKAKTEYILKLLHYYYDIGKVDLLKTETAQPAISLKNLRNILIPIPPFNEQEKIAKILDTQERAIEKEEQYLKKLKQKKQGLMQDLLTGKVRVNHL